MNTAANATNQQIFVTIPKEEFPGIVWKLESIGNTVSNLHEKLESLRFRNDYIALEGNEVRAFCDTLHDVVFVDLEVIIEQSLYDKYIFPGGSQLLTDPKNLGIETEALRKEVWKLQNQMPVGSEESMDCGLAIDQLGFLIRLISTKFEFRESDLITLSMIVDRADYDFSRSLDWLAPNDGGGLDDTVH